MEAQKFGVGLRQLRNQAGMTQRELADRVNIDFSYLSKIESGAMPPPSEKVISQLAEALNADKDELIILAGRIPADVAEILKNRETLRHLRSTRAKQMVPSSEEGGETLHTPKRWLGRKSLSRVVIPIVLVLAVAASLWFAAPVTGTAVAANNQGLVYNNAGDYHKAVGAFDKAIKLDPDLAIAYSNRAWAYIELGEYEQAIADCTRAIAVDPDLAIAYSNRGWAYIELGQYEQAITDYDRAIELDPSIKK